MTYAEALAQGYKPDDIKLQLGYVSRRVDPLLQPVMAAGGHRAGELYVLLHNPCSTRYCYRPYLIR